MKIKQNKKQRVQVAQARGNLNTLDRKHPKVTPRLNAKKILNDPEIKRANKLLDNGKVAVILKTNSKEQEHD